MTASKPSDLLEWDAADALRNFSGPKFAAMIICLSLPESPVVHGALP
jgi:hypothetical protein